MDTRHRLLDGIYQSLKEGNYRPTEAEILQRAHATAEDLRESYGSFQKLLEHIARNGSSEVLRHAATSVVATIRGDEAVVAIAWVLLIGRRMRPEDR